MASSDKWDAVSAALRGDITRAPRGSGRRRRAESAGGQSRARARRAEPSIDEILAVRRSRDLVKDADTEGGPRPAGSSARLTPREFMLTPEFRARRAEVAANLAAARSLGLSVPLPLGFDLDAPAFRAARARVTAESRAVVGKAGGPGTKRTGTPRALSTDEIRKLQQRRAQLNVPALHEAAHAVVAHRLGLAVSSASIRGRHGETDVTVGDHDERWLAVLYAGLRGEQLHEQWDDQWMDLWPLQDDYRSVEEHVATLELSAEDELALRERVIGQVDEILDRYADDVFDLARALVRERTVSGPTLQRILAGGDA